MSPLLEQLEKQARALDASADPDAERLWLEEAQRRYAAYRAGKLAALPGKEVMDRVRRRLG